MPAASGCGDDDSSASPARERPRVDRFDSAAAHRLLREQVELGPRPAGSRASRRLGARLKRLLPGGRYQAVPGGLRNVVGRVPGRGAGFVVLGAHYDTKDLPGFVGANDGASGTAVAVQLARTIRPRSLRRTVVFVLFDGEESPRGSPDAQFARDGLRGSKVAARRYRDARAMVLLDFVGNRRLRIPREGSSDPELWRRLRVAARRVGAGERVSPGHRRDACSTTTCRSSSRGCRRSTSSTSTSTASTAAATTSRRSPSAASTDGGDRAQAPR